MYSLIELRIYSLYASGVGFGTKDYGLTIVQGLNKEFSYNKNLIDLKKEFCCNGTVVQDPELGPAIQLQSDQRKNGLMEKSQGLDPNMRGRFDGFTGILLVYFLLDTSILQINVHDPEFMDNEDPEGAGTAHLYSSIVLPSHVCQLPVFTQPIQMLPSLYVSSTLHLRAFFVSNFLCGFAFCKRNADAVEDFGNKCSVWASLGGSMILYKFFWL
ncbi:hypothetical protein ACJX0J_014936, partial [Zea mays]